MLERICEIVMLNCRRRRRLTDSSLHDRIIIVFQEFFN